MNTSNVMYVNEPIRRSILDSLQDTLKIVERKIYVHRCIYIGHHNVSNIEEMFESIVKDVNSGYFNEPLTGFLIYYPQYFCHIIEGSEDAIMKHFMLLLEQNSDLLGPMKIIVSSYHINQRFVSEWMYMTGKPPTLLKDMGNVESDIEGTARQVKYFVRKIYNLAVALRPTEGQYQGQHESLFSQMSIITSQRASSGILPTRASSERKYGSLMVKRDSSVYANVSGTDVKIQFLPEYNLLDYLIKSESLQDVGILRDIYNVIPEMEAYEDTTWPVPCDFVPYDVFDKPHDPVTDLPSRQVTDKSEANVAETTIIE